LEKKLGSGKSPVETELNTDVPLLRTLSLTQTTFMGIGTAMGGVMFAIMGKAIEIAGPSVLVASLIGALFALLIGLNYAELGASVPGSAGGAISFVRRAYGEGVTTFTAGWFGWIGSITDASISSLVFAFSVKYLLRWVDPYTLAVLTLTVVALINFQGAKTMGFTQFILTTILLFSISLYMAGASYSFDVSRLRPFFPNGTLRGGEDRGQECPEGPDPDSTRHNNPVHRHSTDHDRGGAARGLLQLGHAIAGSCQLFHGPHRRHHRIRGKYSGGFNYDERQHRGGNSYSLRP
jgi:amino acid transporter